MNTHLQSDAIVVGAGILGTSVAHHLLAAGLGKVTVVEAGAPSSGTSSAGAGFVGMWAAGYADFFTETDLVLEQYGLDFYRELAEGGAHIDLRVNGNLFVATTEEGASQWIDPLLVHPFAPADVRGLTSAEVEKVSEGLLPRQSVSTGVLHPSGIQLSAGRATRVLSERVTDAGATFLRDTEVLGVLTSDDRAIGVRTDMGNLFARHVVLACGAWTNEILRDVAAPLPMLRIVASRVISPPSGVNSSIPTVMVPDMYGLWLREHRGGLTWGNGDGYAPMFEVGGELSFGQPRYEELIERLLLKRADEMARLVPQHDTSVAWWLQGVPCMTPDRHFYAGQVPGVPGLFVLAGDNEAGVTHGPGLGRMLSEIVVSGVSQWVDSSDYRLSRFEIGQFPTEQAVMQAMPRRR